MSLICFNSIKPIAEEYHSDIPYGSDLSIMQYTIECIAESDQAIRDMMKGIIGESIVSENKTSTFNEKFNFKNVVKFIIDSFIKVIKKIIAYANIIIMKLFSFTSTAYIKKYKDDLLGFNQTLTVGFKHYSYTNLGIDVPTSSLDDLFQDEYNVLFEELKEIGSEGNREIILDKLKKKQELLSKETNRNYYNRLRARILNDGEEISKEEYIPKLRLLFRNNMEFPVEEDIPSYEVRDMAARFFNGKEMKKEIEDHGKRIENSSSRIASNLSKVSPEQFMKGYVPIDYDIEYALNKILKLKTSQLSETCNIITLAYSQKLTAIQEALKQDKKVLTEAVVVLMKEETE